MRRIKWIKVKLLLPLVMLLFQGKMCAMAALQENPHVTFSPDGNAYTTDAGVSDTRWYDYGTEVYTGAESLLNEPSEGEHYYEKVITGEMPVVRWRVVHRAGRCIHNAYVQEDFFHGVPFKRSKCYNAYFSGWVPYCADCGEQINDKLYYMSEETAKSLSVIDASKAYYYKCPHCENLEQAVEQKAHVCKAVSANKYYVKYLANTGKGYMAASAHMYNNAAFYEGREVTPQTTLSLNTFSKTGFVFTGWNTQADGSGIAYKDGDHILNLAVKEGAVVSLYAQWESCQSSVCIDPAGGSYKGQKEPVLIRGAYGESYTICMEELVPPEGYVIHFDAMGGEAVEDIRGELRFAEWKMAADFYGDLEGMVYYFSDREQVVDTLTASYKEKPVLLPGAYREGYSFGGWYLDKECTRLVGNEGTPFSPGKELTLYAGWVDLRLVSKENYAANQGKGAVDLSWSQKDNTDKVYLVYQKTEATDWQQIYSEAVQGSSYEVNTTIPYSGKTQVYIIPYSGFYRLSLYGAQGGNYGAYQGGKGGKIETTVFLEKGDTLQCQIGGQNGFGNGGRAAKYGNGGGYSKISMLQKGCILLAGGGGGASAMENGYPGGLEIGVVQEPAAKNGACGGGGGYLCGRAGEVTMHHHDSSCMHHHEGSPEVFGGCYTIPVCCENSQFDKKEKERIFYYGNIDDYGNHIFCVRCGSDYCSGHTDIIYCYECTKCKTRYDSKVSQCYALLGYGLGCTGDMTYICGMEEGEIISSKAAYGGSSYRNAEYCYQYSEEAGVRSGDGELQIASEIMGVINGCEWNGVPAPDLEPPEAIEESTIRKTAINEKEIRISFARPKDLGTTYYHQVKSMDLQSNQLICTSNQTVNTLTSGVAGYYYVVDENTETQVDESDLFYREEGLEAFVVAEVLQTEQYLHIAAVDKAGNIGNTIHTRISREDISYWPLRTEKMILTPAGNVISTGQQDTYYVRADGTTPFELEADAMVCGEATLEYQIDWMNLCVSADGSQEGIFSVITPRRTEALAGTFTYPMQALQKKISGELWIQDAGYTVTQRYNHCKSMKLLQRFTIEADYDGCYIWLSPQAAARTAKEMVYSDRESDLENGICLIADGKGPQIQGLDSLNDMECLDLEENSQVTVEMQAVDSGSGLGEFYVEIQNMENGARVKYEDKDMNGRISFVMSGEDVLFHGEFSIMVFAKDRVGNESVEGVNLRGFGLTAYVERILEPHDAWFKRGESGILHIQTTGYVERVEVFFPADLVKEGEPECFVYEYEVPEYMQLEQREFVIPFHAEDGPKTILVKAYKAGTDLEKYPQVLSITVEGSVLDELRTRLR